MSMSHAITGLVATGFLLAFALPLLAAPTPAATPDGSSAQHADAVKRGENLFFEHSFGATPSSVPLKVFEALGDLDARFGPAALGPRYGLLAKPGRSLPVGFVSAQALGIDRLTFNCSLCHTGIIDGRIVPGQPNKDLRMQEFEEDLMGALASPMTDKIMGQVSARHADLSLLEGLQIRAWLALAGRQARAYKPSPHRAGPGRFDLLQTFKKRLGLPPHTWNAQADIPALFGVRMIKRYPRDGALGGDQDLVRYLIVRLSGDNAPLVGGRVPEWVKDLNAYLATLEPPAYPFAVDVALAERGHKVFRNTCTPCHGTYEPGQLSHPNVIIPQAVIGTDPNRVKVWDAAGIAFIRRDPIMQQLDLQPGVGMLPPSLRGVWATSPYLHNGSVPSLHAMLSAPTSRPARFFRGGDAFDAVAVGLPVGEVGGDRQFLFDTTIPGNGNMGHPFGVPLSEDERMAVIEYLKTL
jgi:hypothetical protein